MTRPQSHSGSVAAESSRKQPCPAFAHRNYIIGVVYLLSAHLLPKADYV